MPITVFNADDHPLLRKGIIDLIREAPGLDWAGSAADGREALEKIRSCRPDVALLDIEMPHYSGLEVAQILLAENSPTHFVLFTFYKEKRLLREALDIGIKGYLLKESDEKEIIACIKAVAAGRAYVNASLTHHLLAPRSESASQLEQLTDHERNILRLISRQQTSVEIADQLFLSPKTIANHRSNISKKLGLAGKQNGLLKWAMAHRGELGQGDS